MMPIPVRNKAIANCFGEDDASDTSANIYNFLMILENEFKLGEEIMAPLRFFLEPVAREYD